MGRTLVAIFKAARAMYVIVLVLGVVVFLFPGLGLGAALEERYEDDRILIKLAIGWLFLGVLIEHTRSSILQKRQSYLARTILRNRPDLRREEAIKILIRALESGDGMVVENAHRELKRLTQQQLGTDPAEWRRWLTQEQNKD